MVIGDRDADLNLWILKQYKRLLLLLDDREKDKRQDATARGHQFILCLHGYETNPDSWRTLGWGSLFFIYCRQMAAVCRESLSRGYIYGVVLGSLNLSSANEIINSLPHWR